MEKYALENFLSETDSASSGIATQDLMFKEHGVFKKGFV